MADSQAFHYHYDKNGNRTKLTLPNKDEISYLYYGSGHLSAIKYNDKLISEISRDKLHREIQRTIVKQGTYDNLEHKRSGIVGEHIADYWVWYALGGGHSQHDHAFNTKENNIQGCYKVNAGHQLYQLHTKNANGKGIDSLWKVNRRLGGDKNYCIVDAKSSFTQDKTKSLGALLKDKRPKELRKTQAEIDKLQMSKAWCNKNLEKIGQRSIKNQYSRLILFFKQSTIQQHYAAYVKVIEAINNNHSAQKLQQAMDEHRDNHHIDKQFSEQEIQQRIDQMTGNKKDSEIQDKNEKKKKTKGRTQ